MDVVGPTKETDNQKRMLHGRHDYDEKLFVQDRCLLARILKGRHSSWPPISHPGHLGTSLVALAEGQRTKLFRNAVVGIFYDPLSSGLSQKLIINDDFRFEIYF